MHRDYFILKQITLRALKVSGTHVIKAPCADWVLLADEVIPIPCFTEREAGSKWYQDFPIFHNYIFNLGNIMLFCMVNNWIWQFSNMCIELLSVSQERNT